MTIAGIESPWLYPVRLQPDGLLEFLQLDETAFRAEPFHDHRLEGRFTPAPGRRMGELSRALARGQDGDEDGRLAPAPRYIFHHGFALSTLLSRWLDRAGDTLVYREPLVLTELTQTALGDPGSIASERGRFVLDTVVALLSRTGSPKELPVIKCCDSITGLLSPLLQQHSGARGLALYTDLSTFVVSCLKSASRRKWARDRAHAFRVWDGIGALADVDVNRLTDGQAVACLWAQQLRAFAAGLDRFGDRFEVLYAERLLSDWDRARAEVLSALALPQTVASDAAQAAEPHAKTGAPYDGDSRQREISAHAQALADELGEAVAWFDGEIGQVTLGHTRVTSATQRD